MKDKNERNNPNDRNDKPNRNNPNDRNDKPTRNNPNDRSDKNERNNPNDRKGSQQKSKESVPPMGGEGNRQADRNYRQGVSETVEKTTPEQRSKKAREMTPEELRDARQAEKEGKSHAKS